MLMTTVRPLFTPAAKAFTQVTVTDIGYWYNTNIGEGKVNILLSDKKVGVKEKVCEGTLFAPTVILR